MSGQPPLWLKSMLVKDLQAVGASAPAEELNAEVDDLLRRWNAETRTVYNGRYLALLFERLDEIEGAVSDPSVLRLAAAYQGAKEDPISMYLGEQYRATADSAVDIHERLKHLGVDSAEVERIYNLAVVVQCTNPPEDDLAAKILCDANMAVLALTPQAYAKLCRTLREYTAANQGLSEKQHLQARREHLQRILMRYRIFRTPFAAKWESSVRENLEGELSQIDARLSKIAARTTSADSTQKMTEGTPAVGEPSSSTGPITIRRAPTQKKQREDTSTQTSEADDKPKLTAGDAAAREQVSSETKTGTGKDEVEDSGADDTSTLEVFDGLFSHRRPFRT